MALIDELAAISIAPEIIASRIDFGLKVVTFNVQRWTWLINFVEDFHTEQWDARPHARLIASFLDRYDADVVMMQEAWDSDFILEEMEERGYSGLGSIIGPDPPKFDFGYGLGSGLAYFSRYPFIQLGEIGQVDSNFSYAVSSDVIPDSTLPSGPLPTGATIRARKGWIRLDPATGQLMITNVPADHIAFHTFTQSSGIDGFASKGVAMVKIDFRGSVVTLVNTHLNAGSEAQSTRVLQFKEIDDFLRRNLAENEKNWGHVFFVGDLNADGDHEAEHAEWDHHLQPSTDPNQTLLRRHFVDTWDRFAYPPLWRRDDPAVLPARWVDRTDPGDTTGIFRMSEVRSRIDYILWHPAESPALAVTHPRVLNNAVADSGPRSGAALSDHWPYAVTFVTLDDFASPSRPLRIDGTVESITSTQLDARVLLGTPSSVQWFVVLEPGSYAVGALPNVPDSEVVTEVYRASNLSSPELPVPGELLDIRRILDVHEEVLAAEYRWLPEPIFIKVFQQRPEKGVDNRRANLGYRLVVVPLDGTSPALAPIVSPGLSVEWVIGTQVKIPDRAAIGEIWFKYATIGPFDQSRTQVLELHASTVDSSDAEVHANRLAVLERTATGVPGSVISAAQVAGGTVEPVQGFKNLRIQDPNENWKRRLVRIEVPDSVATGQRLRFGWRTDLCVVPARPDNPSLLLHCKRAKDGFLAGGDDSIRLQLIVDGQAVYPNAQEPHIGDFGNNQSRAIDHIVGCSIGFFDFINITLIESDVFDDDLFEGKRPIEELSPSEQEEKEFSITVSGKSEYTLSGSLARYSPTDSSLRQGTAGPGDAVDCKKAEL